jgi:hypothetical protein
MNVLHVQQFYPSATKFICATYYSPSSIQLVCVGTTITAINELFDELLDLIRDMDINKNRAQSLRPRPTQYKG